MAGLDIGKFQNVADLVMQAAARLRDVAGIVVTNKIASNGKDED